MQLHRFNEQRGPFLKAAAAELNSTVRKPTHYATRQQPATYRREHRVKRFVAHKTPGAQSKALKRTLRHPASGNIDSLLV